MNDKAKTGRKEQLEEAIHNELLKEHIEKAITSFTGLSFVSQYPRTSSQVSLWQTDSRREHT